MTAIFYVKPYDRFIEKESNLRVQFSWRQFLAIEKMQKPKTNLEEKGSLNILKDDFFSRIDTSIFTSIAPELLDRSKKTI